MPMKRCENGHYYDTAKHSTCPSCGVVDFDFPKTGPRAARAPLEKAAEPERGGDKTIALAQKKHGVDPVVGWLVCLRGPDRGRDFRLHAEKNFIGRAPSMDVCIPGDDTVSRDNHATVSYNPKKNAFKLLPGEARGLVYRNGDEVAEPVDLAPFDKIELGQTELMFVPLCGAKFRWEP